MKASSRSHWSVQDQTQRQSYRVIQQHPGSGLSLPILSQKHEIGHVSCGQETVRSCLWLRPASGQSWLRIYYKKHAKAC